MAKRSRSRRQVAQLLLTASIAAVAQSTGVAQSTIPAFSGADGAAANVTGGRGGIVYHVTKLDANFSDVSPGTLRYGLTNANFPLGVPRTIVFDVGGHFNLGRTVAGWDPNGNGWDTQSPLTSRRTSPSPARPRRVRSSSTAG